MHTPAPCTQAPKQPNGASAQCGRSTRRGSSATHRRISSITGSQEIRSMPPPASSGASQGGSSAPASRGAAQRTLQKRSPQVDAYTTQVSLYDLQQLLNEPPSSMQAGDELDMPYTLDHGSLQGPGTARQDVIHLLPPITPRRTQQRQHSGSQPPQGPFEPQPQDPTPADSNHHTARGQRRSYHTYNSSISNTYARPPSANFTFPSNQQQPQQHRYNQQHHSNQQPEGVQGEGFTELHPRQLTKVLSQCYSLLALQQACRAHLDSFNHVHVACAMNRLAKCPEVTRPEYATIAQGMMQTLEVLFVHHLPQYSAREVANAVWCWAKVSHEPKSSTRQMVAAAITAKSGALLRHHACTAQALANLAWGLAGLKWSEPAVWDCITEAVHAALDRHKQARQDPEQHQQQHQQQHQHGGRGAQGAGGGWQRQQSHTQGRRWGQRDDQGRCAPVDLASLAFTYASARRGEMGLFKALMDVVQTEVHEFCAMDLSNVLWACATMRYTPPALFQAAAPAVQSCIAGFTPQGVANTAWAYAIAGVADRQVFAALCRQAVLVAGELLPAHHAQLVWAMVRARQVHPSVVRAAIASAVAQRDAWQNANLSRLLYSLAVGDMARTSEFAELTPVLKQRLRLMCEGEAGGGGEGRGGQRVNFQDVSQVLWAHAMANAYDPELFELGQQLCLTHREQWVASPISFQTLVWSFGYAGHYHAAIFQEAAAQLARISPGASHLTLSQIAGVLVTLGQVQHEDTAAACTAVSAHVTHMCRTDPSSVTNTTLVTVLWALMLLGHVDEQLLQVALPLLSQRWQPQSQYMQFAATSTTGQPGRQRRRPSIQADPYMPEADDEPTALSGMRGARQQQHLQQQLADATADGSGAQGAQQQPWAAGAWDGAAVEEGAAGAAGAHRAGGALGGEHLFQKQLSQLFQLTMWLEDKHSTTHGALIHELLPDSLHVAAREAWTALVHGQCVVSTFQEDLYKGLLALGLNCQLEQLTTDRLFSMDTVVMVGGRPVSVEANGPMHYTRTSPRLMLGSKMLRDRFVRARGYEVLNVPFWEWEELQGDQEAILEYLRERLVREVGPEAEAELKRLQGRRNAPARGGRRIPKQTGR